ncbi:Pr6Pr family membrane protein [Rhodanobacter sp. DHB23]|uniref:Pr6Pr family membrane protein n=1 Tax=Rhodanobacter sp. DHB23 TaxID=2775923 RepID=UPI00177DABB8|nr:Pr6Pr family membrane protein [Rhodanobacter sp. DHB23]MBD8874348.1 Pr6Pr family membrane protein [Rhodanobacter sp. DHB23]
MQHTSNRHRIFAAVAALLGWLTLALQLLLSIRLGIDNGRGAWSGVWTYLGYFTILTNLLVALVLTAAARGPQNAVDRRLLRPGMQTATAMSIVIVAAVYNLMLRQLWQPHGWQIVADNMLHVVMPALFLLHWWLAVPKATLRWPQVFTWQVYPAVYFAYVLLRGAMDGRYPYPFLDVTTLGYLRVLLDACGVLLAFVLVGVALVALGRWQARRSVKTRIAPPTKS